MGAWAEGAFLLFLFSLGHALEHFAMEKARKSIAALADLAPPTALVKRNGETVEVGIEELKIGDLVVVKPNTKIAADGIVVKGESAVNQASITGESVPVDKFPTADPGKEFKDLSAVPAEHRVFSGAINGAGVLEIEVLKEAKDSTLSRLITLVKEAETQKSPTQLFTDRFEKWFVPGGAGAGRAALLCLFSAGRTVQPEFLPGHGGAGRCLALRTGDFDAERRVGGRGEGGEGGRFDKRRRTARRRGPAHRHSF